MDRVGLKELIQAGVAICSDDWRDQDAGEVDADDLRVETVLDRLTQIGIVALEHDLEKLWQDLLDGLATIYRLGVPERERLGQPNEAQAKWLLQVVRRLLALGAVAYHRRRYEKIVALVLREADDGWGRHFWIRYAITLAWRGELHDEFKGKLLIGPVSEYVREKPQLFGLFGQNLDNVVNHLCQFDFLSCVIVCLESGEMGQCYPDFGGYYSHRTLPVVHMPVQGGALREELPKHTDAELAEVLRELNQLTAEVFSSISGWEGYDEPVRNYIAEHVPKHP